MNLLLQLNLSLFFILDFWRFSNSVGRSSHTVVIFHNFGYFLRGWFEEIRGWFVESLLVSHEPLKFLQLVTHVYALTLLHPRR
jgi:hypothetical protein